MRLNFESSFEKLSENHQQQQQNLIFPERTVKKPLIRTGKITI